MPDVDEIFGPTWAPDGHAICFTGMHHGLTDLFVYDMKTGVLRQLTNDPFADVQAAWSPDGRRIAFATDRFSSNITTLAMGPYQLALIDPDSGSVEPLPTIGPGKQINPQWSPDGRSIYFISDREGISNVYRTSLEAGSSDTSQLTTVVTGVSGITSLSPAVSVAAVNGTVAYSVYEGSKYDIMTLDPGARYGSSSGRGARRRQAHRARAAAQPSDAIGPGSYLGVPTGRSTSGCKPCGEPKSRVYPRYPRDEAEPHPAAAARSACARAHSGPGKGCGRYACPAA